MQTFFDGGRWPGFSSISDYDNRLRTENQVLREKIGKRRILLDDDQRRRLAVKGKVLGRKVLAQIGTLVTPDTILRWHRLLVAKKWDYSGANGIFARRCSGAGSAFGGVALGLPE